MTESEQTIGAYYQCHKNAASFIRTVKSFQKSYPGNTIIITNDGGYNYEPFCKKNNIKYSYIEKSNTRQNALIFNSYLSCISFLEKMFQEFKNIDTTHIILLEDDVRILRTHTLPFLFSINGCNENELLDPIAIEILEKKGVIGPFFYGGCGGSVIDKAFFESIDFEDIKQLLYEIKDYPSLFASDKLISFIALYFGGTIGKYDEFAEMWYNDINSRIDGNNVAFLHQYKNDYENNGVFPNDDELIELDDYITKP